jgi:hypothetical protein
MIAGFLALPVIVFSFVCNPKPQHGFQHTATNAFMVEIEEVTYPKSNRFALQAPVTTSKSLAKNKQAVRPFLYAKDIRNNLGK